MPNTIFIALQCCQCLMMQVKQMKKSSNKWTCVVCNQKQSLRRVFAQGFMAKDLRGFVQSFNMSRSQEPEQGGVGVGNAFEAEIEVEMPNKKPKLNKNHAPTGEEAEVGDEKTREHEKARASATSKWSSYLTRDKKEPTNMAASKWSTYMNMTQIDMEPTPKKTNVVSKWHSYMIQDDMDLPTTCQATMSLAASKWRDYKTQDDVEPRRVQPTKTKAASKRSNYLTKGKATITKAASRWCDYKTEGDMEQRPRLPRVGKATSKWDNYVTHEEDELQRVIGRKIVDHIGDWSNGVFETTTNDQKVEEDIHPDFV